MQDAEKDPTKKPKLKSTESWNELQNLQKDILNQKMDALDGMPEGREKEIAAEIKKIKKEEMFPAPKKISL
jgi:DNA polymerase/3'-5' exonuclease PolX